MEPNFSKSLLRGFVILLLVSMLPSLTLPVQAAPGDLSLVSVDSNGTLGNNGSTRPVLSPDGWFVVFESSATNWPIPGTGGLFVRELQTGQTARLGLDGEEAVITSGGRFVAFTAFTSGGTTGTDIYEVYVHDRQTGVTTKISVDSSGVPGNDSSRGPVISDDGRFIAFTSDATNLVADDTNGVADVFIHDMQSGVTERISVATGGSQTNSGSSDASISADGSIVVFSSNATNLVSGDANDRSDIFARDRLTGTTTRVSVNSSGAEADRGATDASVSGNGRFVSFSSTSGNLQSQDSMGFEYVYVHDRQTGATTLASITSSGYPMYGDAEQSVISADGRYVAFQWDDKGDGMAVFVIDVHDRLTGMTSSVVGNHSSGDDWSGLPSISADGRFIAFVSGEILLSSDTNGVSDIYLKEMAYPADASPTVSEVKPFCASVCQYPSPETIIFKVSFSELVTGVGPEDFALTVSGAVTGAAVTGVTFSNNEYNVSVNTGTGDGTLRLDVVDDDSIRDMGLNPLGGPGVGNGNFANGQVYVVDKSMPSVISILRMDPSPTAADTIHYAVTFSEPVTGVDGSDFTLWPSGNITAFMLTQLEGSGANYTVTINTGTGDGTLRLGIGEDDTIIDAVGNPLGGPGIGNGNFEGETYTVNKNAPVVVSSVRQGQNPTSADVVHFTVIFSEPVTGVDQTDFLVTAFGISGTSILQVNGDGISFWIDVVTGTGNGDLRLDVMDNDSILDLVGLQLGGPGLGNGNFTTGESYTISRAVPPPPNLITETFRSNGTNDGWVLESSEDSNQGGSKNSTATTFRLGDDAQDRQYRAILHFPTNYLPDNAMIVEAILMIKVQGSGATDLFYTHRNIAIDIKDGPFGSFGPFGINALQVTDFQDTASRSGVGTIQNNPVSGWYWAMLDSIAFPYINLDGATQFRLSFQQDDNDDLGDDFLTFYSGNYDAQSERPHLVVKYYVLK